MKKPFLMTGALLAVTAGVAEAQVSFQYHRESRRRSLTITYGYPGYGAGYGYSYGPGIVGRIGGGTFRFTSVHPWSVGPYAGYSVYPYGGGAFVGAPGYSYYSGYPSCAFTDYVPVHRPPQGAAARVQGPPADRGVEGGRRRFRLADYRGAVDEFRSAVVADPEDAVAKVYFALALAVTGDPRNADKALRSGVERAVPAKIDLNGLFRDQKERTRVLASLAGVSGEGALTAAYGHALAGDASRLRQLAGKDSVARRLLD